MFFTVPDRLTVQCTGPSRMRPERSFGWNHGQMTDLTILELAFPVQLHILRHMVESETTWNEKNPKMFTDFLLWPFWCIMRVPKAVLKTSLSFLVRLSPSFDPSFVGPDVLNISTEVHVFHCTGQTDRAVYWTVPHAFGKELWLEPWPDDRSDHTGACISRPTSHFKTCGRVRNHLEREESEDVHRFSLMAFLVRHACPEGCPKVLASVSDPMMDFYLSYFTKAWILELSKDLFHNSTQLGSADHQNEPGQERRSHFDQTSLSFLVRLSPSFDPSFVGPRGFDVPRFVDQSIGADQHGDHDVLNNLTEVRSSDHTDQTDRAVPRASRLELRLEPRPDDRTDRTGALLPRPTRHSKTHGRARLSLSREETEDGHAFSSGGPSGLSRKRPYLYPVHPSGSEGPSLTNLHGRLSL
ncbi:hypothetical protein DY000_02051802 [Brassica cretica]|uniref:Uncharacterized protein n=1 Tax=Brassica cretica TaxID=69181 RepID=A0ABQ7AA86_BRACR|nr:hypothetical protein DY000_02051802 [Brassica cretica]